MARKVAADAIGNGYDPAVARSFIDKIEAEIANRDSEKATFASRCRAINETINMHFEEARAAHGIPKKALKTILALRAAEKRKASLVEKLAGGDAESFDILAESLGDFASLPLGYAAVREAREKEVTERNSAALAALSAHGR